MKRRTSRAGTDPVTGPLRRSLPLLLQTLLVVALALPAGFAVAPAFLGPRTPATAAQPAPAWHQVPGTLAAGGASADGIEPLTAAAPVPEPGSLAAQLNETLKADGAGSFTGVVQDAAHRGGPLRPFRRRGPRSRLQHEAPHRRRGPAHARPGTPLQHQGRGRRRPRVGGAHRRRGRAPRRRRISPGRRAGPCRARQPGAGDRPGPAGRRRLRPRDRCCWTTPSSPAPR